MVEPPPHDRHPWARTFDGEDEREVAFISVGCVDDIVRHCEAQAATGVEAMGFLAGGVFSWEGRTYTVARDAVTSDLEASSVHVRFERDAFPRLFERLDGLGYDYILVGWYHSHPGYGCFMSETDRRTQLSGFSEPFHVAVVVDPVGREMAAFRAAGDGDDIEELAMGVFDGDGWPWPGGDRTFTPPPKTH